LISGPGLRLRLSRNSFRPILRVGSWAAWEKFLVAYCQAKRMVLRTAAHRQANRLEIACRWKQRGTPEKTVHFSVSEETETIMSKGQRGNKEAKKPKKVQSAAKPLSPADTMPTLAQKTPDGFKKK
jgi:hypothetical protein